MNSYKISLAGIVVAFGALMAPDAFGISGTTRTGAPEGTILQGYEAYNAEETLGWYYVDAEGNTTYAWTDLYGQNASPLIFGWMKNGNICGVSSLIQGGMMYYYQYLEIDPESGEYVESFSIPLRQNGVNDYTNYYTIAAYVPSEDRIYGYGYNTSSDAIVFKSSASDFSDTRFIREVSDSEICFSLTYNDTDGKLIGFNGESFVQIDLLSGVQTSVYTPAADLNYQKTNTAIVFDNISKQYYWNYFTRDSKSHLATVDMNARRINVVKNYDNQTLFKVLCNMPKAVDPNAPAPAEFVGINLPEGATSGTVKFRLPSAGNNVAATDKVKWTLSAGSYTLAQGEGTPGEEVTAEVNNVPEGQIYFTIVVEVNGYESLPAQELFFVGIDTPASPENVVLASDGLKWEAVTKGQHDGYVDPASVVYNIYLNNELQGTTSETSYAIKFPEGLTYSVYQASVEAAIGEKISLPSLSNTLLFGTPLDIPVTFTPSDEQALLFSTEDVDGNGNCWTYDNSISNRGSFISGFSSNSRIEEWLFLPPVDASDPDAVYQISMRAGLNSETGNRAILDIKAGTEAKADAMTYEILTNRVLTDNRQNLLTGLFTKTGALKDADQVVIGVRVYVPSGGSQVRARNFQITKTNMSVQAPAAVSNVRAVAGAKGALTATISFKMPTTRLNGEAIPEDTEIEVAVLGDNKVTVKGLPGSNHNVEVEAFRGINEFTITPKIGNDAGAPTSLELYCGVDIPGGVSNFVVDVDETNMTANITWDAPEVGLNGGYINPEELTYAFCLYNSSTGEYEPVQDLGSSRSYSFSASSQTLANYRFAIQSKSEAGVTPQLVGERVQLGRPYSLPMDENFYDTKDAKPAMHYAPYTLVTSEAYAGTSWTIDDPSTIRADYANPNKVAMIGSCDGANRIGFLEFPKFSTSGKSGLSMVFTIYQGQYSPKVTLYARTVGMEEYAEIGVIPNSTESGYKSVEVKFPADYDDKGWVSVYMSPHYDSAIQNVIMNRFRVLCPEISVEEVAQSGYAVYGSVGEITVEAEAGVPVTVYAVDGCSAASFESTGSDTVKLPAGIYVVRIGSETVKTLVR